MNAVNFMWETAKESHSRVGKQSKEGRQLCEAPDAQTAAPAGTRDLWELPHLRGAGLQFLYRRSRWALFWSCPRWHGVWSTSGRLAPLGDSCSREGPQGRAVGSAVEAGPLVNSQEGCGLVSGQTSARAGISITRHKTSKAQEPTSESVIHI